MDLGHGSSLALLQLTTWSINLKLILDTNYEIFCNYDNLFEHGLLYFHTMWSMIEHHIWIFLFLKSFKVKNIPVFCVKNPYFFQYFV